MSLPVIGDPTIPVLETERLILRGHRLEDFPSCAALWADPEVTRFISSAPLGAEEAWARFLRYAGHWAMMGYGYWAVEEKGSGRYLANVGFANARRAMSPRLGDDPEVGWVFASEAAGRGYATEAVLGRCNGATAPSRADAPSASSHRSMSDRSA